MVPPAADFARVRNSRRVAQTAQDSRVEQVASEMHPVYFAALSIIFALSLDLVHQHKQPV
jgi:hypothetical protein